MRQRFIRLPRLTLGTALAAVMVLGACETTPDRTRKGRPPEKPATVTARLTPSAKAPLSRASISTKSGEILILEEDGSVTTMDLDSDAGQDAFALTEADLAALNVNLDLNLGGVMAASIPKRQTQQEKALEDFAKRTQPALPRLARGLVIDPEDFIGARVASLSSDGVDRKSSRLVEVTANLRQGVDADIAFSYATCTLARWAKANGAAYGRHIRTLQDTRDGKLLIGAAFTISDTRPMGLRVMETNETLRECKARGIPAA